MNSSGYHKIKKFPKENDTQFDQKIHAHDLLESARFHLIKVLEKGCKFNAGYYVAEIFEPLSQWRSIEAAGNKRKLLGQADNALPHAAKLSGQYFNENRMKSTPHPPCSPDLVPSDFYLFGHIKRCLAGFSFEDADQLLAAVEGVLEGIEKSDLASGLSRVDGPIKEIYHYQLGVY
jgi:hypothetical protein